MFGEASLKVWDLLIAAAIAVPVVVVCVWLLLRGVARADEAAVQTLIARLDCPRCRIRSLEWRGMVWAEDLLYDDHEESLGGFILCCSQCGYEFQYTDAGQLHRGKP